MLRGVDDSPKKLLVSPKFETAVLNSAFIALDSALYFLVYSTIPIPVSSGGKHEYAQEHFSFFLIKRKKNCVVLAKKNAHIVPKIGL